MTDRPAPSTGLRHAPERAARRLPAASRPLPAVRAAPPATRRRRKRRWLSAIGFVLLAVLCLIAGAATFLIVAAPADFVRDQLVSQVKARTGRDLVISGPTSISLLPRVSVRLSGVSLSSPPAVGGAPVLTAETFAIDVALSSLLSRRLTVERLLLVRPAIELRIDAQGRSNWDIASASGPSRHAGEATPAPAPFQAAALLARAAVAPGLDHVTLENVQISGGAIRYVDERKGVGGELTDVDLALSLADLSGPLSAKGSAAWNGERLSFDGKMSPARTLLGAQRGRVAVSLSGRPARASYDGTLELGAALALDGKASVNSPSLRALGAWLGRPVAADPGAFAFSGPVSIANGRIALPDVSAELGGSLLTGNLQIDTSRERPHIGGSLRTSELDFGRLLTGSAASGAGGPPPLADSASRPGQAAIGPGGETAGKAPSGNERPVQSEGRGQASGWSDAPFDFSPLARADADLALTVDRVLYKDLKTGQSRLSLALAGGVAKLTLDEMLLYGGRGRGVVTLDASSARPAAGAYVVLENVLSRPLLKDALDVDWLTGRGKITLALAGRGETERKMVEALNGKVELAIGDGEFAGIDVGKLMGAIARAQINRIEISPEDKTPFSELAGSFDIVNGVAGTNDLRLVGPHVRVNAAGTAHLPERRADFLARLRIAEMPPVEGAVINVSNLEFPMRVSGPWEKLSFRPDLKGFLNSEQVGDAIRQIGKNLDTPEVRDAVKGLLGGGDGQKRVKPRELIEKLLKKQ